MLSVTGTTIEIKPENITPKGLLKFIYYFMIALGLPTFFFGGFIFVIIGVWALFIQPKNVKNNYPISYRLTPNEFTTYGCGGQIAWSIPWSDIESLYIVSQHWAVPK